jgi:hypothetical protein
MNTLSIRRAVDTIRATGGFIEELVVSRKNYAAASSQVCEKLRDIMVIEEPSDSSLLTFDIRDSENGYAVVSTNALGRQLTLTPEQKNAAGPLLFPGSSLHKALVSLEKYHATIAEKEAIRWKNASSKMGENVPEDGILPIIRESAKLAHERAQRREQALINAQEQMAEAESNLRAKKEQSMMLWGKVAYLESEVKNKVAEMVRKRSREREMKRRQEEVTKHAQLDSGKLNSTVTSQEIWELVSKVGEIGEDFAPSDLPAPSFYGPIDQTYSKSQTFENSPSKTIVEEEYSPQVASEIDDYRCTIETEIGLHQLRMAAIESDEAVQDAAGALLNAISAADTTKRSARVAAETCLLSTANVQMHCLKSLVQLEKESLQERLRLLNELEENVSGIDVRNDLNSFLEHEKAEVPNGASKLGDNDDGGIASALAVLNSHSEGIGVGVGVAGMAELSSFSGWEESGENTKVYDREELEEAVETLFSSDCINDEGKDELKSAVEFLTKAVAERSSRARGYRASTCYAMNNQRGKVSSLKFQEQFDGLCRVLESLLDGCDRESADVASAKMVMMLAQTFYMVKEEDKDDTSRSKRMYPKDKLCQHPIWLDEDFWVQALFQCVTDSLSNSGVMVRVKVKKSDLNRAKTKMKWHDLRPADRLDAASQVHAVIFAQLGALAHSMIEFGCSKEKACSFVRRLSVRHQLPLEQRTMLLTHLLSHDSVATPSS